MKVNDKRVCKSGHLGGEGSAHVYYRVRKRDGTFAREHLRVSHWLRERLEETAREWGCSVSATFSTILSEAYPPALMEEAWRMNADGVPRSEIVEFVLNDMRSRGIFVDFP
jgi:hypothetical protein